MDRVLSAVGSRIEDSTMSSPTKSVATAKKAKKRKAEDMAKTYRFNIDLSKGPGTQGYFEFNWLDLITQEVASKRKNIEEKAKSRSKPLTGLDPYASDDEEKLQAIAKSFEAKYGGTLDKIKKKKKERKLNDCADLGFGYDSDDSFIDNSDVHDEMVPANITTAHGGFYINCGNLEFKPRESADEDSDVEAVFQEGEKAAAANKRRRKKKSISIDQSINQESSGQQASGSSLNLLQGDEAQKQRARKEGGKPLGRPKKRNPDGTLVHPPKPPRQPKLDSHGKILTKKMHQGDFKLKKVNKVLPPGSTNVFTGKPLNTGANEKSSESNSSSPVKPPLAVTPTSVVSKPKSTEVPVPLGLNSKELNDAAMRMIASFQKDALFQMAKSMQQEPRRDVPVTPQSTSTLTIKKTPPKQDNVVQSQAAKKVVTTSVDILMSQRNGIKVPTAIEKPKTELLKKKTNQDSVKKPGLEKMSPQSLRDLYNMYAVKMEDAFNKGDKAAYARLNDEVKGICDSITAKQPKNPKQQALTKPVSSSVAKPVATPTHLPSGITIESVSSAAKRDQESAASVSQKPTESTLTVSAVQAKTLSVSSGVTIPPLPKSTNGTTISPVSLPISSTSKILHQGENIVSKPQLTVFSSPSQSKKVSSGVEPKEPTKGFTITPTQARLPVSHGPPTKLSTQLSVSSLLSSSSNAKPNELPTIPCFQNSELDLSLPSKSQTLSDGFGVQQSKLKVKSVSTLMDPQLLTKEALPVSSPSPRSDLGSPHNLKKEVSILQVPDAPKQQPTSFKKEIIMSSKCDSTSSSVASSRPIVESSRVKEERHPLNLTPTMNFNQPSKLQVSDAEKHQSNNPFLDLGLTLDMFNQPNNLTTSIGKEVSLDDTLKSIFAQQQPLSKRECTTNQQRAPVATSKSIDSVLDFSIESKQPSCSNPLQIKKETALAYQILPDSSGQSFLSELSNKSSYQQQSVDQFMNNKPSSSYSDVQLPYSSFDAELAALVSELASSAGQASDFAKSLADEPLQLTQPQSEQGNSKGPNVFSLEKDTRGFSPSHMKSEQQISAPQMQPINFTAQSLVSGFSPVSTSEQRQQNSPSASNQQLLHVTTIPSDQTKIVYQRQLHQPHLQQQQQQVQQQQQQQVQQQQQQQALQQQQQQQQVQKQQQQQQAQKQQQALQQQQQQQAQKQQQALQQQQQAQKQQQALQQQQQAQKQQQALQQQQVQKQQQQAQKQQVQQQQQAQQQRQIQQQQYQAQQQHNQFQRQQLQQRQHQMQQQNRQQTHQSNPQPNIDSTILFPTQPLPSVEMSHHPQIIQRSQSQPFGQQKVTVYGSSVQSSSPLSSQSSKVQSIHVLQTSSPSQMISNVPSMSSQSPSFSSPSSSVVLKSSSLTKPTISVLASQPTYVSQQSLSKPQSMISQTNPSFTVSSLSQVPRSPSQVTLSSPNSARVVPVSGSIPNVRVGYFQTSVSSPNQGITTLPAITIPARSVISQQLMGNTATTSYFDPSGSNPLDGSTQITHPTLFKSAHQNHIIHIQQHPNQQHHPNNF